MITPSRETIIKYKLLWSQNSTFRISITYILLLQDSMINKRFLSPKLYYSRINFFNGNGMEIEFKKRKKHYKIPDYSITSCAYFFLNFVSFIFYTAGSY